MRKNPIFGKNRISIVQLIAILYSSDDKNYNFSHFLKFSFLKPTQTMFPFLFTFIFEVPLPYLTPPSKHYLHHALQFPIRVLR